MAAGAAVAQAFAKDYSKVVGMTDDLTSIREYLDHIRICFIGLTALAYGMACVHLLFRYCDQRRAAAYDVASSRHHRDGGAAAGYDVEGGMDRYDRGVSNPDWAYAAAGQTATVTADTHVAGGGYHGGGILVNYSKPPGKDSHSGNTVQFYRSASEVAKEDEAAASLITPTRGGGGSAVYQGGDYQRNTTSAYPRTHPASSAYPSGAERGGPNDYQDGGAAFDEGIPLTTAGGVANYTIAASTTSSSAPYPADADVSGLDHASLTRSMSPRRPASFVSTLPTVTEGPTEPAWNDNNSLDDREAFASPKTAKNDNSNPIVFSCYTPDDISDSSQPAMSTAAADALYSTAPTSSIVERKHGDRHLPPNPGEIYSKPKPIKSRNPYDDASTLQSTSSAAVVASTSSTHVDATRTLSHRTASDSVSIDGLDNDGGMFSRGGSFIG